MMGFSQGQTRALSRKVPARNVKTRLSAGKELTYIEGWYALSQANRIFGFDGWDRETVETKCLQQRETRGHCLAVYCARVRITVRTDDRVVVRDGHGTGEAHGDSAGEVHDRALKAAETDATKRALATFGKAFGLALYAGAGRSAETNGKLVSPPEWREPSAQGTNWSERSQTVSSQRPYSGARMEATTPVANGAVKADLFDGSGTVIDANTETAPERSSVGSTERGEQRQQHQNGSADRVAEGNGHGQPAGVDKSALALSEPRRLRDKDHLRFVASQPCLLCSALPCDAHHLRFAQPRALGRKVGDDHTVPLCRKHHQDLHESGNEAAWWHDMGIDALEIAKELWNESVTARLKSAGLAR